MCCSVLWCVVVCCSATRGSGSKACGESLYTLHIIFNTRSLDSSSSVVAVVAAAIVTVIVIVIVTVIVGFMIRIILTGRRTDSSVV